MERVPSAKIIGVVCMPGRNVIFHKRSVDCSGKCDLVEVPVFACAFGVLYDLPSSQRAGLDAAEGFGNGYSEARLQLSLQGRSYQPFVYVASSTHIDPTLRPYHWYKALVLAGARYHHFPSSYINALAAVESIPDPDSLRATEHRLLLERIYRFE